MGHLKLTRKGPHVNKCLPTLLLSQEVLSDTTQALLQIRRNVSSYARLEIKLTYGVCERECMIFFFYATYWIRETECPNQHRRKGGGQEVRGHTGSGLL